jgi:hypothetical protein
MRSGKMRPSNIDHSAQRSRAVAENPCFESTGIFVVVAIAVQITKTSEAAAKSAAERTDERTRVRLFDTRDLI